MIRVRQAFATLLKGILAGFFIGLGAYLYLVVGSYNKIVGALFFALGLTIILNLGYFLYTGKICYLFNYFKKTSNLPYPIQLIIGLIGNYIGATILGLVLLLITSKIPTENFITMLDVKEIVTNKMQNPWYVTLILAILCNIMIYIAVEGFTKASSNLGKYVILIGSIAGFVLMCFEHCVADMFYLAFSNTFSWESVGFILIVILGNTIGALIIPSMIMLIKRLEKRGN